jgi:hypothetical protein
VGDAEGSDHVDAEDEIPVGIGHLREAGVAQDAGVVDDDIDAPERINGGLDDGGAVFDRVIACDRFSSSGLDCGDDGISGCG